MYRALTRDIEVTVEPYYLEDQSDPEDSRYVWGYRVVISNHSDQIVQLRSRHWQITDENGICRRSSRARRRWRATGARARGHL
jgi:ApaG protein